MKLYLLLFTAVLAVAVLQTRGAESLSLAAAAGTLKAQVPAGAVVTGESNAGAEEFALVGHSPLPDLPPERVVFEIGSISKVFTSLLLAQAVVEQRVSLETTVRDILGTERKLADPRVGAVTLRQLSTHTSGLPRLPSDLAAGADPKDPYAHYDREKLIAGLEKEKLVGEAPFPSSYSNLGAALLGELLSRVYGETWEELVARKITGPLGMPDTVVKLSDEQQRRLAPPHQGADAVAPWRLNSFVGAGGLHSTAHDLVRFGQALLEAEKGPLAEAFPLLLKPQTEDGEIGLGIMRSHFDGQLVYEHSGGTGGYCTCWQVTPNTRRVRVVLSSDGQLAGETVLAVARGEKPRQTDSGRVPDAAELAACTGVYRVDENSSFTILQRDGTLWARLTGQAFLRLSPHELADRFFYKDVAAELKFQRTEGRVSAVTLFQNGRELKAIKTDTPPPALLFPTAEELAAYAGQYNVQPGVVFTVKVVGDTLFVQLTGQGFVPVFATKRDAFEYDVVPANITFQRNEAGKIISLVLLQNGRVVPAAKAP